MNQFINIAMRSDVRSLVAAGKQATDVMGATAQAASLLGTSFDRLNQRLKLIGAGMLAASAGIAMGFFKAGKAAGSFESELRNVFTIADRSQLSFNKASDAILKMSLKVPQTASELASGLYDIVSSGIQGADALFVLNASARAASAGLTDTKTAAQVIVGVLNAYGLSAMDAVRVSDVLFQTVNLGVLSFSDLAQGAGEFVGLAAQLGVSLQEVSAAYAAMTLASVRAAEAPTSVARTMQAFINPSKEMTDYLNKNNFASGQAMLAQLGLHGTIVKIIKDTGGEASALADLFQNVNALQGVLALAAGNGDNYNRVLGQIKDSQATAGATARAFVEQSKGSEMQTKRFSNAVAALRIQIGQYLLPYMTKAVSIGSGFVGMLVNMPSPIRAAMAAFTGLNALILAVGGALLVSRARVLLIEKAIGVALPGANAKLLASLTSLRGILFNVITWATKNVPAFAAITSSAMTIATAATTALTVALMAAGAAYLYFSMKRAQAAAEVKSLVQGMTAEAEGQEGAQLKSVLEAFGTKNVVAAQKLGVNMGTVVQAINGSDYATKSLTQSLLDLLPAQMRTGANFELMEQTIKGSGSAYSELLNQVGVEGPGHFDKGAYAVIKLADAIGSQGDQVRKATLEFNAQSKALKEITAAGGLTEDQLKKYKQTQEELDKAQKEWLSTNSDLVSAFAGWINPLKDYQDMLDDLKQKEQERAEAVANSTTTSADSWKDYVKDVSVSLGQWEKKLSADVRAMQKWNANLAKVASLPRGRGGPDITQFFAEMGQEGAPLLEKFVTGDAGTQARIATDIRKISDMTNAKTAQDAQSTWNILAKESEIGGRKAVNAVIQSLRDGKKDWSAVAAEYGFILNAAIQGDRLIILADGTITTETRLGATVGAGQAYAGIHGMVPDANAIAAANRGIASVSRAEGGFLPSQATIRRNMAVQWAEPGTGGEAFIPLAHSKRRNAMRVWAAVGRQFGVVRPMSDGGIFYHESAGSGRSGGMSSRGLERALANLVRQGVVQNIQINEAASMSGQHIAKSLAWEMR